MNDCWKGFVEEKRRKVPFREYIVVFVEITVVVWKIVRSFVSF